MSQNRTPKRGASHGLIDNFYLSKDELLYNSPSRQAGVDADTEREQRVFGCERIQLGVLHLKLPQAVAATGQVLLHRFYCKHSLTDYDVKRAAIAAIWLASKLEESPRKFRDVLCVFHRIEWRSEGHSQDEQPDLLDLFSAKFDRLKADIFRIEKSMLRAFGFVTHVEHPHKFVLSMLQILMPQIKSPSDDGIKPIVPHPLAQDAWNLTNDSLRTTLCVRFKSEVVAAGIIFLAARRQKVVFPETPGSSWWDLCITSKVDVLEVANEIYSLYQMPKAKYVQLVSTSAKPASSLQQQQQPSAAASPLSHAPSPVVSLPNGEPRSAPRGGSGDGSADRKGAAGDVSGGDGGATDSRAQSASGPQKTREGAHTNSRSVHRSPSNSPSSSTSGTPGKVTRAQSSDRRRTRSRSVERHSADRRAERPQPRDGRGSSRPQDREARDRDRTSNGHHDVGDGRSEQDSRGHYGVAHGSRPRSSGISDRGDRGRSVEAAGRLPGSGRDAESGRKRDSGRQDQDRKRDRPLPSSDGQDRKRSRLTPDDQVSRPPSRSAPRSRTPPSSSDRNAQPKPSSEPSGKGDKSSGAARLAGPLHRPSSRGPALSGKDREGLSDHDRQRMRDVERERARDRDRERPSSSSGRVSLDSGRDSARLAERQQPRPTSRGPPVDSRDRARPSDRDRDKERASRDREYGAAVVKSPPDDRLPSRTGGDARDRPLRTPDPPRVRLVPTDKRHRPSSRGPSPAGTAARD